MVQLQQNGVHNHNQYRWHQNQKVMMQQLKEQGKSTFWDKEHIKEQEDSIKKFQINDFMQ